MCIRDSDRIWLDTVCSRFDSSLHQHLKTNNNITCSDSSTMHENHLRDLFLLNVIITLLLAFSSAVVLLKVDSKAIVQIALLIFINVLNIALLPYYYGKVHRPTIFNEVIVKAEKIYPGMGKDIDSGEKIKSEHGFLLSRNDDVVVMFSKRELHIWIIPAKNVALIKLERQGDVLQYYLKRLLEETGDSPEPPV